MTAHRGERVADRIQRILSHLVQVELADPRVGFVTLTEVRLSQDLRHARVYFTTLDPEDPDACLDALNHAASFLRRKLAREAGLRYTPSLTFIHDDAETRGRRVDALLDRLREGRQDLE